MVRCPAMTLETPNDCGASCTCGPPARSRLLSINVDPPQFSATADPGAHAVRQAEVPPGRFLMGDSSGDGNHGDGEEPRHPITLDGFSIDATTVTNDDFARFAEETGYRTEAEAFGYSAVFHLAITAAESDIMGPAARTPWWVGVKGADWRHPGGRLSDVDGDGFGRHPAVHISWNDAIAYCEWAGRRLPTEAEWEYAARGGLDGATYPWGDDAPDVGGWRANIWQGRFPHDNSLDDGYLTTAPADSFAPNGYGLHQAVGNVWEWCQDWFSAGYYRDSPSFSPTGPSTGTERVLRGGSYLCHDSYCNRYRNSARSRNTPDSSMGNAGFRTVAR